jgi:hypothetical protein
MVPLKRTDRGCGILTIALIAACTTSAPQGSERGECYPNATCDQGLACYSSVCVRDVPPDADVRDVAADEASSPEDVPSPVDAPEPTDLAVADSSPPDVAADTSTPRDAPMATDAPPVDGNAPDAPVGPTVAIWHPSDMEVGRTARMPIPFVGHAEDARGVVLTGAALAWSSSLTGPMGTGERVTVTLSAGMHVVTLTARDGAGRMGTASIRLTVAP